METWHLIALTILALIVSSSAALFVYNRKAGDQRGNTSANFNSLAAEDLINVVIGVPLKEIVCVGDTVEIIIKTNGYSITSSEYLVKHWYGRLKLTRKAGG